MIYDMSQRTVKQLLWNFELGREQDVCWCLFVPDCWHLFFMQDQYCSMLPTMTHDDTMINQRLY